MFWNRKWPRLASDLRQLGLWAHLPPAEADKHQRGVAGGEYPFGLELECCFADGENLAEQGVEEFLTDLAPALQRHGVALQVETVALPETDGDEYAVAINGRRCLVWGPDDWTYGRPWYTSTTRPLAIVNDLLAEAGAAVRVFTLHTGGNEGIAFILRPEIIAAIHRSGLLAPRDTPELPTDTAL
ncbi:hypothetical protein [Dactylosporangium sp. NPDC051541]|uniref:hypothetical protein n=1 Tax=Dactylosporangium sp. NPDC051541 TaxID=3363977 RepID=UPI00378E3619